jgi:hypothetical protein
MVRLLVGCGVSLVIFGVACGSGGREPDTSSDGTEEPSLCEQLDGTSCDCGEGFTEPSSHWVCGSDGILTCDCSRCPELSLSGDDQAFTACGGEPFGAWRLQGRDLSHFRALIFADGVAERCDAVASEIDAGDVLIELESGGDARVRFDDGRVEFSVANSCVKQIESRGCLALGHGSQGLDGCSLDVCGVCKCSEGGSSYVDDLASWSRKGGVLNITELGGATHAYDYCVDGDRLTLHDLDSLELYDLSRVSISGSPKPCSTRSVEGCNIDGQCGVGSCVGADCPDASGEEECTNVEGCDWDPSVCAGETPSGCSIQGYGKVPGCEITDNP